MNYCILTTDGYVAGIASSDNPLPNPVTEAEKNAVFAFLCDKPIAPDGYEYKLKADTLEWELVELPPAPEPSEDVDDSEALDIILGGGDA